jgi:hypothetical protein
VGDGETGSVLQEADRACYHTQQGFIGTCHALRELLDLVPEVERLSAASIVNTVTAATKHLSAEQRQQATTMALGILNDLTEQARGPESGHDEDSPDAEELEKEISDAKKQIVRKRAQTSAPIADLDVATAVGEIASDFLLRIDHTPTNHILLRAIITELIAALEQVVGRLHASFYTAHPEALGSEKEFSLADLRSFSSVDEAVADAISKRVDAFLRLGFDDWETWFKKYLKLNLREFFVDAARALEVIQRRNVIVHNDGRVSRQYRAAVGDAGPSLATVLVTDEAYVNGAIDEILIFGATLAAAAWQKIAPRNGAAKTSNHQLHVLNMRLMLLGRWQAVSGLAAVARAVVADSDSDKLTYQVNGWLATKRQNGREAIFDDVSKLDVSAAGLRYKVAVAALLDDLDDVGRLLPKALDADDMSMTDVHSWPLLEEFRATPAYASLIAAHVVLERPLSQSPATPEPTTAPAKRLRRVAKSGAGVEVSDANGRIH